MSLKICKVPAEIDQFYFVWLHKKTVWQNMNTFIFTFSILISKHYDYCTSNPGPPTCHSISYHKFILTAHLVHYFLLLLNKINK